MKKFFLIILLIIIATLYVLAVTDHKTPSDNLTNSTQNQTQTEDKWVTLAKALTAKGAKVYGASWCSACKAQKKMFGDAWQYVTYVECADPKNPNKQTQACITAKIEGYPTWVFADGSREDDTLTFEQLFQKTL